MALGNKVDVCGLKDMRVWSQGIHTAARKFPWLQEILQKNALNYSCLSRTGKLNLQY